jgi:hypothetical protein
MRAPSAPPPPREPPLDAVAVSDTELAAAAPRGFAQLKPYVVTPAAAGVSVWVPLAASAPLQLPEAVQPVA